MDIKNSKFMADCSQNDKGKEAIMSFQISWILRCASDSDIKQRFPKLYNKTRDITFKLLGMEQSDNTNVEISNVKVWKEWNNIDILANIKLSKNGVPEPYQVLIVENKVYTQLTEAQRDEYPNKVILEYNDYGGEFIGYQLHQVIISCLEPEGQEFLNLQEMCKGTKWRVLNYSDLVDWDTEELTESDLFNEFWYARWDPISE